MRWNPLEWVLRVFEATGLEPPDGIAGCRSNIDLGRMAVHVARGEIGQGEVERNNVSARLDYYRTSLITDKRGSRGAWCAAFCSWVYERTAELNGLPVPDVRSHSAKRLFKNVARQGERVTIPRQGDLVCWHRGKTGGRYNWTGHVGLISRVRVPGDSSVDPLFWYIAGNEGRFPSKVREHRAKDMDRLVGFARL